MSRLQQLAGLLVNFPTAAQPLNEPLAASEQDVEETAQPIGTPVEEQAAKSIERQTPIATPAQAGSEKSLEPPDFTPILIPLAAIRKSPFQPRKRFSTEKIQTMAVSFRKYRDRGDYPKTAILVRPIQDEYELIFGEQRKLAHELAGFTEILAFVESNLNDEDARELALTENLLREDLNPVEKTEAILNLVAVRLHLTTTEVKQLLDRAANDRRLGTDNVTRTLQWQKLEEVFSGLPEQINPESFRSNYLPLLNLPADVLEYLHNGNLEYTKARAISSLKDEKQRKQLLRQAVNQDLSIRAIRSQIRVLKASERSVKAALSTVAQADALIQQCVRLSQKMQKSSALKDSKQAAEIQALLDELERIL